MLNKCIKGIVYLLFCFTAFSINAQEEGLSLKWEVPIKGLAYYITMSEIDTAAFQFNNDIMNNFGFDSATLDVSKQFFAELKKNAPSDFIAYMK